MRITHLSAEVIPFAKTGGLGDVAAALPKALHARGHDVDVFMPFHLDCASWFRRRNAWPETAVEPFRVGDLHSGVHDGLTGQGRPAGRSLLGPDGSVPAPLARLLRCHVINRSRTPYSRGRTPYSVKYTVRRDRYGVR